MPFELPRIVICEVTNKPIAPNVGRHRLTERLMLPLKTRRELNDVGTRRV